MGKAIFWELEGALGLEGPGWGRCMALALGPWVHRLPVTPEGLEDALPAFPQGPAGALWWEGRIAAFARVFGDLGLPPAWAELCARRVRSTALCPGLYRVRGQVAPALAVACYKGYENYLLGDAPPEAVGLLAALHLGQFFAGAAVSGQVGACWGDPAYLPRARQAAGDPGVCWLLGGSPRQRKEARALGWNTAKLAGEKGPADLVGEDFSQLLRQL